MVSNKTKVCGLVAAYLGLLFWVSTPGFDYDESLYVAMSEEMISSGNYLTTIWDGKLMDDKPPTFMWTLVPFLELESLIPFKGLSRVASLLGTALIILMTFLFAKSIFFKETKEQNPEETNSNIAIPLLFATAFLPFAGAGLLLIDPLLSTALVVPFCLYWRNWNQAKPDQLPLLLGLKETIVIGLFLALACSLKGLVAFVIPGLALSLQFASVMIYRKAQGLNLLSFFKRFLAICVPAFTLGLLISFVFYGALWIDGQKEFVTQFFLKHHLSRGTSAMEGHGGSMAYHWIVILVGGSWLVNAFLRLVSFSSVRRSLMRPNASFPLFWFLSAPIFFTFMATKLPNYTWTSWMALPVMVLYCLRVNAVDKADKHPSSRSDDKGAPLFIHKSVVAFATLIRAASAIAFLFGGLALLVAPFLESQFKNAHPVVGEILSHAGEFTAIESVALVAMGICFVSLAHLIWSLTKATKTQHFYSLAFKVAAAHSIFIVAALAGVSSFPKRAYIDPVAAAAKHVSREFPTLPVATFGIKSPWFSSNYFGSAVPVQKGENSKNPHASLAEYALLIPKWSKNNCSTFDSNQMKEFGFLTLCARILSPIR